MLEKYLAKFGFEEVQLKSILQSFHKTKYLKNEGFFKNNESFYKIGIIESGLFKMIYKSNRKNLIKDFCIEGDTIGVYSSILTNLPPRFDIVASEESQVWVSDFTELKKKFAGYLPFIILQKNLAESLYIKKEKREADLILLSAETRYKEFLNEKGNLSSRLKDHEIASYLGITNVGLSRIKARIFPQKNE
ncbi:Crp/Fnr family transcriptional regulator [Leptospira sp. GIMC2001]|uniref:Crp/Fnr family transcriptional regulator n=1 Tax=Leptospira sp. GIMC2001 TaxID=1513297 RepID=UPI00234B89F9|nr:Crp/Fnr family transcriptional regulator [Leptospira sp. GIMC2001]WCL47773.1 Crp/Fnr family transcriptional regulator [Leptospira sp. GIMC2001]